MHTVSQNIMPRIKTLQDCYYYYYSSCTKGDSCPYRHEPAALTSETVCRYWLQGICNKQNCIFRHTSPSVDRSHIACYYERQPSGCTKVHCPFLHENVLNHPREEVVQQQPDNILPLKSDDKGIEEKLSEIISTAKNSSRAVISPNFGQQLVNPCIVSLYDDDSDEGSPLKNNSSYSLSAYSDEIKKLNEIIETESTIVGYNPNQYSPIPYGNYSDNSNDESDAVHRRIKILHNDIQITSMNGPPSAQNTRSYSHHPFEVSSPPTQNTKSYGHHSVEASRPLTQNRSYKHLPVEVSPPPTQNTRSYSHYPVDVSLPPINVRMNGAIQQDQSFPAANNPHRSIKSRLGRLPEKPVQESLRSASTSRRIRERITLSKDNVNLSSVNGAQSNSIKNRLSMKNSNPHETFSHTEVNGAIKDNFLMASFHVKSLKEINEGKRKRTDSSSPNQNFTSKHMCQGKSTSSTVKKRKHKPIVFDLNFSAKVNSHPKKSILSSRSVDIPPISHPIKNFACQPPTNTITRPLANVEMSVDSFIEDDLLNGSILDYDEEELDEDLLLNGS